MGHGDDLLSLPRFLSLTISPQLLQQRLGLLEVRCVEALGEPVEDRRRQLTDFHALALALPPPAQANRRAQLQGFRLLAPGRLEGLMETGLSLRLMLGRERQQQLPLESIQPRPPPALYHPQPFLYLSYILIRLDQQAKITRSRHPCGPVGDQSLADLRDPSLPLALLDQRPAPQDRCLCQPEGKPLLARQHERFLSPLVGHVRLPTTLMDIGSKDQGSSQTEGMRQLAGQGQRLLAPLQGLVGIAKVPQYSGETGEAKHPEVVPGEDMGAVRLGIVEGDALLQVRADGAPLSEEEQGIPQHDMGICEAYWILDTLGQAQHLFPQLPRGVELPAVDIKKHQAPQHGEELRGLPYLLAQLARPVIGGGHFRGR